MAGDGKAPLTIKLCNAMIRAAAQLVPAAQQQDWKQEWLAEVWHRWQFLAGTENWNRREEVGLVRSCLGSFADGAWHLGSHEQVQSRAREWARSPWMCLMALAGLLGIAAAASGGFAATRQLYFGLQHQRGNLLFLWQHPSMGGGDRGLPPDVAPAWTKHSRLLEGAAGFTVSHAVVKAPRVGTARPLVVRTDPSLFAVLGVRPRVGAIPQHGGVVLDDHIWRSMFHGDRNVIGSRIAVASGSYLITAVLPAGFQFLSRQNSIYVVQPEMTDAAVMVIARARPGATADQLTRELTDIAESACAYYFRSDLRIAFLENAVLTPLGFFGIAVLIAVLMTAAVSRARMRRWRRAWQPKYREATLRRGAFLMAKTGLALALVFVAVLEWSRPESALLFASRDPASGPLLVWLYILGAMGVLFWSLADQRARCRVCLRLLCFPVRIGCPGCLLLDWSGTELLCAEGHGVLHVPHLAASWEEEQEHWIQLDESWQELFAQR